jgi:nifR3 family TIM-barrel protein
MYQNKRQIYKFASPINKILIHIGQIPLPDKALFLAPMEDVTDPSFRFICKHFGADMVYTEFIPSDGLIRNAKKSLKKLEITDDERPVGIQLYGHLIDSMVEAAIIAGEAGPDLIDINFGCPVRKIANRGAGAGMLCNIPLMVEMTKAIVNAVKLPVTVKTRLGWDDNTRHIVDIAEQLQDVGIKAITIHGRTRAQLYKGNADWTLIGAVKNNPRMKIPVIGNGDIVTPQSARLAFDTYGVDGIMIGRATVGRPWIFKEIRHFLDSGELLPPVTLGQKVDLARLQFRKSIEVKGLPRGIFEMRRHFSNYFKGLPDFREIRMKLVTSMDIEEIEKTLDVILATYQQN